MGHTWAEAIAGPVIVAAVLGVYFAGRAIIEWWGGRD